MLLCCLSCSDLISKQLDQCARVLRESGSVSDNIVAGSRLHCLLGNMITAALHHRDVTDSMLTTRIFLLITSTRAFTVGFLVSLLASLYETLPADLAEILQGMLGLA